MLSLFPHSAPAFLFWASVAASVGLIISLLSTLGPDRSGRPSLSLSRSECPEPDASRRERLYLLTNSPSSEAVPRCPCWSTRLGKSGGHANALPTCDSHSIARHRIVIVSKRLIGMRAQAWRQIEQAIRLARANGQSLRCRVGKCCKLPLQSWRGKKCEDGSSMCLSAGG